MQILWQQFHRPLWCVIVRHLHNYLICCFHHIEPKSVEKRLIVMRNNEKCRQNNKKLCKCSINMRFCFIKSSWDEALSKGASTTILLQFRRFGLYYLEADIVRMFTNLWPTNHVKIELKDIDHEPTFLC